MGSFARLAFTPAVQAVQEAMGSRRAYDRARLDGSQDSLGEIEQEFLAERDSFYMASIGETNWPYIQHRGGPKGFVRVLDERTIAFADLRGNKQYISAGNVAGNDRVALIFVDYPQRARLKILGHAQVVTQASDAALYERVAGSPGEGSASRTERVFVIRVEGLDWNCPQHITPRFTDIEIREMTQPLVDRVASLEKENAQLREALARSR